MNTHPVSLSVAHALLRSAKAESEAGRPQSAVTTPFTITISREVGALGTAVGTAIGERLGWPVYDRTIVEKIAEEIRQPAFHLQAFDERPAHWLDDCLTALSSRYKVNADVYLKYLIGAIRGLGKVGHCVIVGRGANCILPPESTLRVRLVAELPDRIRVMAQQHGVSEKEAAALVEKTDRERDHFVRQRFGQNPADPHLYDLLLNTSRLNVEECAEIILAALRVRDKEESLLEADAAR